MHIALIGATGLLGTGILPEAVSRGHTVTAICRHPEHLPTLYGATAVTCAVYDTEWLTQVLRGTNGRIHQAVIHCFSPRRDHDINRTGPHVAATRSIIAATRMQVLPGCSQQEGPARCCYRMIPR
nr:NAD(P)H-binding protein [Novosphingobium sp.]